MQEKVQIGIIDSDSSVLQVVQNIIERENYTCDTFTNPEEAIKKIESSKYDLIISEWEFPSSDGNALFKSISQKVNNIPIIFLTQVRDPDIRLKALQMGAIDYIAKPFDRSYLLAKIKSIISILKKNSKDQNDDPYSFRDITTSLVKHFQDNNIHDIFPKSDVNSENGFSYDLESIWPDDNVPQDKRLYFLEKASSENKLEKRIYDIIQTCPKCKSFHLNLRSICEVCHSPAVALNVDSTKTDKKFVCKQCSSEFETIDKAYFCLACGFEFAEKVAVSKYIYSFHLQDKNQHKTEDMLEKIADEHKFRYFAGELFDPFFRLQKQQHDIIQQPYALLRMKFSMVSSDRFTEKDTKYIGHIVLILKKMLGSNQYVFIHKPNILSIFFPSTNFKNAGEIEKRFKSFLERLDLNQSVELQLISNDLEDTLKFLETDSSTETQLP